jgi:ribonuclease D
LSSLASSEVPAVLVTTADVERAVSEARSSGRVGLDTEFMREKTYRARLCLIQVATPHSIYLIDPLAGVDLSGIGTIIADPDVEVVVHAGRQDFEIFVELFGVLPRRVFDVQLAAGFAGFGASMPYGRLVEEVSGVPVTKGEAYTDWCRRPLTSAQCKYAANDVRYLLDVAAALKHRLAELGRAGWVEEEMAALETPETYATAPEDAWRRVPGRATLNPRQTAVLKELARWREETAARRNIPRGWVIKDATLVEIARRAPSSAAALKAIRGINAKEAERSADAIIAATERGRNGAPIESGRGPSRSALARARMLSGLADAVVRARCERAGVATELVATRAELEALLVDPSPEPVRYRLLRGWRRELAGNAVLDLVSGRIAVRALQDPPFIEEVPE